MITNSHAIPSQKTHDTSHPCKVLIFKVDQYCLAINISQVREIRCMMEISWLPINDWEFDGIINLRGTQLPVISLRRRMGINSSPFHPDYRIIVVTSAGREVGLIVDQVVGPQKVDTHTNNKTHSLITNPDLFAGDLPIDINESEHHLIDLEVLLKDADIQLPLIA